MTIPAISSAKDPRITARLAGSISFAKPVFGAPTVPVPVPELALQELLAE
jgi:hypothetical protein